jgi:hypothetical protein
MTRREWCWLWPLFIHDTKHDLFFASLPYCPDLEQANIFEAEEVLIEHGSRSSFS